jgi:hypothetical protein
MPYQIFIINLLIIWGIYAAFKPDMIFSKLDILLRSKLYSKFLPSKVDYYLKPFYKCPICMPSVWGAPVFIVFIQEPLYLLPVYVVSMVGFNYIVAQLISKEIDVNVND